MATFYDNAYLDKYLGKTVLISIYDDILETREPEFVYETFVITHIVLPAKGYENIEPSYRLIFSSPCGDWDIFYSDIPNLHFVVID